MCGIVGFTWPDRELITRMTAAVAHRGPDDEGWYLGPRISLGHRRLSIIDLSANGRQPLCNEDGSVRVVFNGEIYNFGELRRGAAGGRSHFSKPVRLRGSRSRPSSLYP
jgi:asparagine synthase (glutamine-hydrolysing)